MDTSLLKKYRPPVIVLLLLFFALVAFILRILPAIVMQDQAFYPVYDTDSWYNLRQIEVMVHNFPQYNWFDPMTAYPMGKMVDWGPLYPFLAASLCLLTGAVTRSAVISTAGFVSPLLAALMVPVMYGLGKKLGDFRTGLVAAGLIPLTSLLYFSFSSYGMIDHHIAEVFFSSIFFLLYLCALAYVRKDPVNFNNLKTHRYFILLSILAGAIYFLGLITSTTLILALLVIALYTLVQGLADFYSGRSSDYLFILNVILLSETMLLLILFGFRSEGISFSQYSPGTVFIHLAVLAETVAIYILGKIFRNRRAGFFISIAALGAGVIVISQIIPSFHAITQQALNLLFGTSVYSVGVEETLSWSWANAFSAINVGIILAAGGFLVLGYSIRKSQDREMVLFGVWSILMLLLTIQHQRFLYYFTVNIVLLSALCITEPFRWEQNPAGRYLSSFFSGNGEERTEATPESRSPAPAKRGKKKRADASPGKTRAAGTWLAGICIAAVCLLAVLHIAISFQQDYQYGMSAGDRVIPGDWIESLQWLNASSPDPGIDYFGQYDRRTYSAPAGSYGVMAVWDAGHWITFFARRPAITNPFQDNLGGPRGTATFFLSDNESEATAILEAYQGRYVITDAGMAVDRFTNLVPWESGSVDISHYIKWFLVPEAGNRLHLEKIHMYDDGYFQTMVVRLHTFDGSMTDPTTAEYTRYEIRLPTAQESADATGYSRVITDEKTVAVSGLDAATPLVPEGEDLLPTTYAALYSTMPDKPVQKVPALRQYRLIHESDHNTSAVPFPESGPVELQGIKMVKIFEYVKGARISGTGIIELPLVTNTGRTFVYRQESSGGEFVVPYSTQGNPYDVRATGPYHIAGTSRFINVTEEDVTGGRQISAGA